jgi:hypothetical protein
VKLSLYIKKKVKPEQPEQQQNNLGFVRSSLALGIKTAVMEIVSVRIYWLYETMFKLYGGEAAKECTAGE